MSNPAFQGQPGQQYPQMPQNGYGAPQQGYGAPQDQNYGAPTGGGYAPAPQQGYGAPAPQQGYAPAQQQNYGAPQQGGYNQRQGNYQNLPPLPPRTVQARDLIDGNRKYHIRGTVTFGRISQPIMPGTPEMDRLNTDINGNARRNQTKSPACTISLANAELIRENPNEPMNPNEIYLSESLHDSTDPNKGKTYKIISKGSTQNPGYAVPRAAVVKDVPRLDNEGQPMTDPTTGEVQMTKQVTPVQLTGELETGVPVILVLRCFRSRNHPENGSWHLDEVIIQEPEVRYYQGRNQDETLANVLGYTFAPPASGQAQFSAQQQNTMMPPAMQQNAYGAPAAPQGYGAPQQAPQGYGAQPAYGAPQVPAYGAAPQVAPQQAPAMQQPAYGAPVAPQQAPQGYGQVPVVPQQTPQQVPAYGVPAMPQQAPQQAVQSEQAPQPVAEAQPMIPAPEEPKPVPVPQVGEVASTTVRTSPWNDLSQPNS